MTHLNDSHILKEFGGSVANDLNSALSSKNNDEDIDLSSYSPYVTFRQLPDYVSHINKDFSIFTLNCQSINAKFDQIYLVLNELLTKNKFRFSCVLLQECFLEPVSQDGSLPDVSMYKIPGYNTFALGACCSSNGGLICYISDTIEANRKNEIKDSRHWEALFLELNGIDTKPIIVGNIYRPPRSNNNNKSIENFIKEINPVINNLTSENQYVFLGGDFNIDVLQIANRQKYADFLDIMMASGFLPKITYPTRFAKKSASLLDQIFIKHRTFSNQQSLSGILHAPISDHFGAFTSLPLSTPEENPKYVTVHKQDADSISKFKHAIASADIMSKINLNPLTDPNYTYDIMEHEILKAKEKYLPSKKVKFNKYKHKKKNWITTGILQSIHHRDKLYRKFKSCKHSDAVYETNKLIYNDYNKSLNRLIKLAKTDYYRNEFDKHSNNIKKTWQTINQILNRDRNNTNFPSYIIMQNKKVYNKEEIANSFNDYFATIGENLANKIAPSNTSYQDFLKKRILTSFSFQLVEHAEITKVIKDFKPKTSSGSDGISMKILKSIAEPLIPPITMLVNQSLTTGTFPDKFKIAKIIPLIKKPNIFNIDNFRPISLLASISKIIEKCVCNQVYSYFEANKHFNGSQYGYRKIHSTETACLELVDKLMKNLDKGETPIGFFLDLSKAFDTLDHNILLNKLHHYGVKGIELQWFHSYLSNRTQYVEIDGIKSQQKEIRTGVPQGSILGPLLFIIYMNDINNVSSKFEAILYADDTSLSAVLKTFGSRNSGEISNNINKDLALFCNWLKANKLSLNIKKTKYMIFRYSQRPVNSLPKLKLEIDGHNLERVTTFEFLGITINETLTWKNHIHKVGTKISKVICILARTKKFLHSSILTKIYNSLILSRINYGILCWGFEHKRIYELQKKAIRLVCKTRYNAHTDPLFLQLKTLKVKDIFRIQCLKFFYNHEKKKSLPQYFQNFIIRNPVGHTHNTRQREVFQSEHTKKVTSEKTLRYFLSKFIQTIPEPIINTVYTHSLQTVKRKLKIHYLGSYQANCSIRNCYVCNRL